MFTGIIETLAKVVAVEREGTNLHLTLESDLTNELKIDQSLAHNGVCLTVVKIDGSKYTVTAIEETLLKSAIGELEIGSVVNLERAMQMGARLDGHIVQGHVDTTATCTEVINKDGSWIFSFEYPSNPEHITIEKGSITVDGTSLTVVNSKENSFSVAIIPYTYEHTRFNSYQVGTKVNLEFDLVGKYIAKLHARQQ
ncbi:MAG: riboflavin synthase [Flavobacteriaceae bacterium]|jgi:riboflavin synthase